MIIRKQLVIMLMMLVATLAQAQAPSKRMFRDWQAVAGSRTVASAVGGENVLSMLHFDGTNNSTTIIDSSTNNISISCAGDAKLSTANPKFGSSALRTTTTGYTISASAIPYAMLATNFTIEVWLSLTVGTNNAYYPLCSEGVMIATGDDCPWYFLIYSGTLRFGYFKTAGTGEELIITMSMTTNYTHLAVSRSANTLYMFQDGTSLGTTNISAWSFPTTHKQLVVGRMRDGVGGSSYHYTDGTLDELRISDVCRWTNNFTVPTGPYSP